ncbi:hypothetical protein BDW59DRAFT_175603 [Aspergillus cavernicola]|uniref:P-loop containing nucleoside triphosphate hydrolase protein n=1 Tax=Aspergillus cavernicola TaxID=176166 RepID=A0ABR4HNK3_9EURO
MSQYLPSCPAHIDRSFGPWARSCRGGFDFTLLFEETILAIPLSCLFLLVLPIRMLHLIHTQTKVVKSPLRQFKVVLSACLASIDLTILVLWITSPRSAITLTAATIPTSALTLIASLGLSVISWFEHARTIRPSFLINIYLFLSVLLDTARVRTLWMLGPYKAIPAAFTCSLVLRCGMLVLESVEKRKILAFDVKNVSKDSTSGPFSHSIFYWLSSLFLNGYRKTLSLDDLYPLSKDLRSKNLAINLQVAWDDVLDKKRPHALLLTWLWAYRWTLLFAAIPRLFMIGFTFAQPFLISSAISLAASTSTDEYDSYGYGLIGAYAIVYTGIAISTGQYEYVVSRLIVVLRGSVIPSLFHHALHLDISDTSGEDSLTLINTDLETIGQGIRVLHEIWASSVEIGIAIWLLARQIHLACLAPVGFAIAIMGTCAAIAAPMGRSQAAWIQASQKRVTLTSKVLANVKSLRLSGISAAMFSVIQSLRITELIIARRFRFLLGAAAMFSNCTPILSPILMFATFVGIATHTGDSFTILKAFSSLSLLSLLNNPLTIVLYSFPSLASAITSFARIQDFMNRKTRDDMRVCRPKSHYLSEGANNIWTDHYSSGIHSDQVEMDRITLGTNGELIAFVQGHASLPYSDDRMIRIPGWRIYRGTFTVILGPVGSGKSTLLRCLLGEHSKFNGGMQLNTGSMAFCSESPWIPARNVQEVVIGEELFDASWYGDVLDACALRQDLDAWPHGDKMLVGSKGVALSGGQKQRLALARAVYSKREVLILDNVFSGLDMQTRETVLRKLFGEDGLLRQRGVTTILASSQGRGYITFDHACSEADTALVSDSIFAHRIALLNQDGTLEEQERQSFKAQRSSVEGLSYSAREGVNDQALNNPAVEVEDDMARYTDLSVYVFYFKSAGLVPCVIFLLGMAVFAFCYSFPVLWLKWWSEASETRPNSETGKWLSVYVVLGIAGTVGFLIGIWVLLIVMIANSGQYFHTLLVETVSRATMGFFSSVKHGSIINRFSQDMQLVDMELPLNATNTSALFFLCFAQCVLLGISSRYVAVSFPFLAAAFYSVQRFYLRTSRQMRLLDIGHKAPVYSHFVETLNGLSTIRAFGWERESTRLIHKALDDSQRPYYLLYCLQAWLTVVLNLITAVLALIIITVSMTLRESIGPGYIGVSLTNILTFSAIFKSLISAWVGLEISIGAITRIRYFSSGTKREHSAHSAAVSDEEWPREGKIEYRNVSATYGSSNLVLDNVSFSIRQGQKLAVCGRTGSGKSSLALSLFRMLEILGGQILVDDVDIMSLDPDYVRNRLVAVPQDIIIFEGTVRLNLDPTNSLEDREIVLALQKVQIWTVVDQKGGLDANVTESSFSQGEQQLLGFARAMLRKSRVLVLDEAASSLDDETKKVIDLLLNVHFKDWTVISILHQLETVLAFDKVAVMDNGRLVEFDEPHVLLASNSIFQRLYRIHQDANQNPTD